MKYGFIGTGCMGGALATACAKAIGPEDILLSNRSQIGRASCRERV